MTLGKQRSRLRRLISFRRRRERLFSSTFFADPSWDIMLELALCDTEGRQVSVSAIGLSAGLPPTTVLRHLVQLEEEGVVRRYPDPMDGRRSYVALTDASARQMHSLMAELLPDITDRAGLHALANELRAVADDLVKRASSDA